MTGGQSAATAGTPSTRLAGTPGSPPVRFTQDILAAARAAGITAGLYIGCGNGRNYLPLTAAGLDLTGGDISAAAITQLTARAPQRRHQLILGDLTTLPAGARYPLVIGIQVFQHGDRAAAHAHIRAAQKRVTPGGLFCLRVNAIATDIWPEHEVTERDPDGGLTDRYLSGPKQGLDIHFFSAKELDALFTGTFTPTLPLAAAAHLAWSTPARPMGPMGSHLAEDHLTCRPRQPADSADSELAHRYAGRFRASATATASSTASSSPSSKPSAAFRTLSARSAPAHARAYSQAAAWMAGSPRSLPVSSSAHACRYCRSRADSLSASVSRAISLAASEAAYSGSSAAIFRLTAIRTFCSLRVSASWSTGLAAW